MSRLAALLLSFVAVFASLAFAQDTHPILPIGSPAPDFSLPGVDGKIHKLSDYSSSKILVIVFTCDHCPTAQLYETRIERLAADYRDRGVALLAIQPNNPAAIRLDELGYTDVSDSFDDMKIRAAYRHFDFPYLYDGDTQTVARAYGPQATPHVFIFDKERKLRYEGRVDNSQRESLVKTQNARDAIDALLAGRPVAVTHTGVFGCSTKWISKEAGRVAEMKKIEAEPITVNLASDADLKKLRSNPTGKVLLVNFWATWCGGCVHELPDLETTWRMYRLRDYDFVTVSANMPDEEPGVLKYLNKLHGSSRNLLFGSTDTDEMQHAFSSSWEGSLPYSMLLSPDGKVLYEHQGEVDILKLRRVILGNLPDPDYIGHRAYWAASPQ
ncbi:MAG: redoxin family protein [Acidobacteriaceae bacterium]|nr:redoxin family protein [Acidobacteriaceae bacterium]